MKKESRGFTLIEILIAIAIVAILVTFMMPNFIGIRIRARDTRRKSDLSQIQKALELYKSDQNPPAYPATGFFNSALCGICWSSTANCGGNIYMRNVPCDPQSAAPTPYIFTRDPDDSLKYSLSACLENASDPDEDPVTISECSGQSKKSYTVNEP